jgi:RND superfamily putative drug exporter
MTVTEDTPPTLDTGARGEGLLARMGRRAASRPRRVVLGWLLIVAVAIAAPLAVTVTSALSGAGWEAQGSTAQRVRDELRSDFPQLGAESAVVAYRQSSPIADDPAGLKALVAKLTGSKGTTDVINPLTAPAGAGLISPNGRSALIVVGLKAVSDADRPESAGDVMATVASGDLSEGAEANATGEWAVWHDFTALNEQALHKAELLSGRRRRQLRVRHPGVPTRLRGVAARRAGPGPARLARPQAPHRELLALTSRACPARSGPTSINEGAIPWRSSPSKPRHSVIGAT